MSTPLPPSLDPNTPVIVGVGQHLNRDESSLLDPLALAVIAARAAAEDCASSSADSVLAGLDAVGVVPIVSWRYGDPGPQIAAALGATPSLTLYPSMGGNTPQMLMNRVCERIAAGQLSSALVCGAEAYRTRMRARKSDAPLPWERQDLELQPGWTDGSAFDMAHQAELALGVMMPTQTYPMFENALRHEAGRSADEHSAYIAGIWSRYSEVAAANPNAWDRTFYSPDEIATVTASNRIVGFPYTKHMVSNPDVDMASAVIVCSVARATELGVPRDRWVFPHSGADGKDRYLSTRASFTGSPAIRHAGRAALDLAGVAIDDVAHLDVYSCFPSAVEIGCAELGISTDRQLTVYGGLCFAGGPWNNPVGHAIAAMVDVLRSDPGSRGLVTANGGNVQKHSFGVYSTEPPASGFRTANPQAEIDAVPPVDVAEGYEGPATIEAWTVMHDRDGSRGRAHATVRTPEGARAWAATNDADVAEALEAADPTGWAVTIGPDADLRLG
ncbi:MAG: acetyl-CoA acetyltransferase [Acidimicrobiales bacterium]